MWKSSRELVEVDALKYKKKKRVGGATSIGLYGSVTA